MQPRGDDDVNGKIAYVLKGYPRISELFIASEILRVETAGVPLEIFSIKARDEEVVHEVVKRIRARPHYLPQILSVSSVRFATWLAQSRPIVASALAFSLRRHPLGLARASLSALAQAFRSRRRFWAPPRKLYLKELFQAVLLVHEISKVNDIRHLHAHFCHGTATVSWLASLITGLPFSFTAHAKDIYSMKLNPAGLLVRKLRAARFAVTCTGANRDHLLALCPTARVHRIYHGLNLDFENLLAEDTQPRIEPKNLAILAVGRLVRKKGFDVLADACAELAREGVDFRVSIYGEEGDARRELEARIKKHGLADRFFLKGPTLQAGLYRAMRQSSVMALPCRILGDGDRDGIPNVLVEAMASGLPVVTTPISGIPELVVDQKNGLFVPPDDAASLAKTLASLYADPEFGAQLSKEAIRTVALHFDADKETSKLISHFRHAL